jgi:serine/threonine protein kinase
MYFEQDFIDFNNNIYGEYIKQKILNEGTTSDVILANKIGGGKFVLKVLSKDYTRLAMNEINMLKALKDVPGVIKYIEHFENALEIIIVLEYINGCDLYDYICNFDNLLDKQITKTIFRNICTTMSIVHKKGICHKDLKPENIMINPDTLNITIIDWAYSFNIENKDTYQCGSPNYVAPEIIKKEDYQGPEIDIWSLGAIYYSLVTSQLAFQGNMNTLREKLALFDNIINIRVNYNVPGLNPEIIDILKKIFVEKEKRITIDDLINYIN